MNLSLLLPTLRRGPIPGPSSLRVEVCPPSLRHAPDSLWNRALFWLMAPAPLDSAPAPNRLQPVRADFHDALMDVDTPDVCDLWERIEQARTLRELWHLRADVFRAVAVQHSQGEAECRLFRLNRHFPTRSPRSGFVPL